MKNRLLLALILIMSPLITWGLNVDINDIGLGVDEDPATAITILILLTLLSLAPAILVVLTSFTRIIIVLSMLRHAFGMPETPPNIVLISLALFLTYFTMTPVLTEIETDALTPYINKELNSKEALNQAMLPLRRFMVSNTREKDLRLMLEISNTEIPQSFEDVPNSILIPSFMISELQTAFQIGFVIFLPFLIIDLIVASILMSMGMIMVPPLTISLPIKILMFVLIEGWVLVIGALVGSFN